MKVVCPNVSTKTKQTRPCNDPYILILSFHKTPSRSRAYFFYVYTSFKYGVNWHLYCISSVMEKLRVNCLAMTLAIWVKIQSKPDWTARGSDDQFSEMECASFVRTGFRTDAICKRAAKFMFVLIENGRLARDNGCHCLPFVDVWGIGEAWTCPTRAPYQMGCWLGW